MPRLLLRLYRPRPINHGATEAADAEMTQDQRLRALFAASDEDNLRRNPIAALFRGDMRYADRLGDFLTDEYIAGELGAAQSELAALRQIDRSALTPTNQIAYDIFERGREEQIRDFSPELLALTQVRPVNHFSGFHTFYPTIATTNGPVPFATVEDYENNLSRHRDFIAISDRAIARFREGMESGVFESQMTIGRVIEQLDGQLAQGVDESSLFHPGTKFPG